MDEINPYASPQAEAEGLSPAAKGMLEHEAGVWRKGSLLVMHRKARLPDRCVITNQPSSTRVRRNLTGRPRSFSLSPTPEEVVLEFPVSGSWIRARNQKLVLSAAVMILGALSFSVGIAASIYGLVSEPGYFIMVVGGMVLGILGVAAVDRTAATLRSQEITKTHAYLKGADPDYLASLPEWPYD